MPELHKNQIQWQAPEPQKVAFDKPNYQPLAEAADYISRLSDDLSQRKQKMLDENLAADLKLAEDEANQIIDDEQSATADYGKLSEMALSKLQGAFYKYDEATRKRFTEGHKTYFDEIQLAVSEKILQKTAKQIKTDVKVNLPLWASEAVVAGTPEARQAGVHKIQSTLKGLASPAEIEEFVYQYNNMIDKSNLNNLITAGTEESYAKARALINDPKHRPSIDPYEASVFNARIIAGEQEIAKAKKKADDPMSLELIKTYGEYSSAGETMSALDLIDRVSSGKEIMIPQRDKDTGEIRMLYVNAADMPVAQRLGIITEMKKYDALNPSFQIDKDNFNSEVSDALLLYKKSLSESTSGQDEALTLLTQLQDNLLFKYVEGGTREEIAGYINGQLKARVEASLGEEQQYRVNKYGFIGATPGISYDKKVGNPVNILSQSMSEARLMSNPSSEIRGGIMDKLVRDQANQSTGLKVMANSPAERIIRGLMPLGMPKYQHNITMSMLGAAKIYKDRFAKDMNDDSVAELGLFNKILLPAMRDNNMLAGTRFGKTNLTYEKAFTQWSSEMKRQDLYNKRTDSDNAKNVERFYEILVGDKLNSYEKERIRTINDWAKSGQANDDWSDMEAYLFSPSAPDAQAVKGSNQSRNLGLMKATAAAKSSTRIDKAIKENKF